MLKKSKKQVASAKSDPKLASRAARRREERRREARRRAGLESEQPVLIFRPVPIVERG